MNGRFYIPILRTLRSRSKRLAEKQVRTVEINGAGQEVVKSGVELVPEERVLKYLPLGNYKWYGRRQAHALSSPSEHSPPQVGIRDRYHRQTKAYAEARRRHQWAHRVAVGAPQRVHGRVLNALYAKAHRRRPARHIAGVKRAGEPDYAGAQGRTGDVRPRPDQMVLRSGCTVSDRGPRFSSICVWCPV